MDLPRSEEERLPLPPQLRLLARRLAEPQFRLHSRLHLIVKLHEIHVLTGAVFCDLQKFYDTRESRPARQFRRIPFKADRSGGLWHCQYPSRCV